MPQCSGTTYPIISVPSHLNTLNTHLTNHFYSTYPISIPQPTQNSPLCSLRSHGTSIRPDSRLILHFIFFHSHIIHTLLFSGTVSRNKPTTSVADFMRHYKTSSFTLLSFHFISSSFYSFSNFTI